ncbi:MAG: VOC family protein [Aquitalea sp.]|nr:VOC family protein [Aquitalea sp.]
MKINPYLMYNGQCEAAFQFYQRCLAANLTALHRYADAPCEQPMVPADFADKIMHARLESHGTVLMGSDCPPAMYQGAVKSCSVSLNVESAEQAEQVFAALAENGQITMPIQSTFWALRFGCLIDQFGVPWMINCERTPGS